MDLSEECPICLNVYQYPVVLPECGHIFCYLCVKGFKNPICALCRAPFELQNINTKDLTCSEVSLPDEHEWLYKGCNGWWKYDSRTAQEIEEAYQKKLSNVEVLVAGNLYNIDFEMMLQTQKNDPRRCRHIRRQKKSESYNTIGIAGLR
ncbi:unnamed protein product [Diamesa tonsa]